MQRPDCDWHETGLELDTAAPLIRLLKAHVKANVLSDECAAAVTATVAFLRDLSTSGGRSGARQRRMVETLEFLAARQSKSPGGDTWSGGGGDGFDTSRRARRTDEAVGVDRQAYGRKALQLAGELVARAASVRYYRRFAELEHLPSVQAILASAPGVRSAFVRLTAERIAEIPRKIGRPQPGWDARYYNLRGAEHYPLAESIVCERLLRSTLPFSDDDLLSIVSDLASLQIVTTSTIPFVDKIVTLLERRAEAGPLPPYLVAASRRLQNALNSISNAPEQKLVGRLSRLPATGPQPPICPGEAWSDAAIAHLQSGQKAHSIGWRDLIVQCGSSSAASPSAAWLKQAEAHMASVGLAEFRSCILRWFPLVDRPRTQVITDWNREYQPDPYQLLIEPHSDILKGLVWCCALREDKDIARALTALALSAYRKIPKKGPREVKIGNACVYALGAMPGMEGVAQLALLKVRVKFGTAQKMIEKALEATAKRVGLPRDELEEMAVPAYGLTGVGVCEEPMGEFTARLTVSGRGTDLVWLKPDGRVQKSTPASVKAEHAEELKELQGAAKDIQRMLPAQRERIDTLFLQQKTWPFPVWRERYLDHPLVGVIARRLLWEFTTSGKTTAGIWFDAAGVRRDAGGLVNLDLRPIPDLGPGTTVRLWHPIGKDPDEILAWRGWLDEQQIQQPFKQAHREVYLLTDAERQTRTYSNRYAAHVLRQHQFNALCAARGWKNKLRLLVDAEFPPATLYLPKWNLRAEFWIEGAGDDYGTDTNEAGTFLYLTTDQVRFYRTDAGRVTARAGGGGYEAPGGDEPADPLSLENVPPLVFSEVMRDVDLFVGVASVGNDPTWSDGGPEGRYQAYWQSYSFGDLSATAKTRRAVLERLIPRLKIAAQCSLTDKFLVVKGSLRGYRIHLGSGNILMEPNDQYLCIVPRQTTTIGEGRVFLPFEGDTTLSVILSKAFLLADDTGIKDPTILSQIRR